MSSKKLTYAAPAALFVRIIAAGEIIRKTEGTLCSGGGGVVKCSRCDEEYFKRDMVMCRVLCGYQ